MCTILDVKCCTPDAFLWFTFQLETILRMPCFFWKLGFGNQGTYISLFTNLDLVYTDYRPMLELLELLVETFISPSSIPLVEDRSSEEVVDKIMQLMLCILDGIMHTSNDMSTISDLPLQWAPVFKLRNSRYYSAGELLRVIRG